MGRDSYVQIDKSDSDRLDLLESQTEDLTVIYLEEMLNQNLSDWLRMAYEICNLFTEIDPSMEGRFVHAIDE